MQPYAEISDKTNESFHPYSQRHFHSHHLITSTKDRPDGDEKKLELNSHFKNHWTPNIKKSVLTSTALVSALLNCDYTKELADDKADNIKNGHNSEDIFSPDANFSNLQIQHSRGLVSDYFDSLPLEDFEKAGLLSLYEWIIHDKSTKIPEEICLGDIVLSYFSSFSKNNPDPKGCWKRWILYRNESPLKDLNKNKIKEFYETGVFSIGYDNEDRPVWFINLKYYDMEFGPEIIAKCATLWITSLLWNLSTNEFDFDALRKGICVYCDMSHWSLNLVSWNIVKLVKNALVAFPFQLIDIYVVNTPTFIYLMRQIASKVFIPHAMDKFRILNDQKEYMEKYAPKDQTPSWTGGSNETTTIEWLKNRGYIE